MFDKHFAQTLSKGSKHLDQKGGSLMVTNSSKYLAILSELIPIELGMISGTLNSPIYAKHCAQNLSFCPKHLDQKGGSLTV